MYFSIKWRRTIVSKHDGCRSAPVDRDLSGRLAAGGGRRDDGAADSAVNREVVFRERRDTVALTGPPKRNLYEHARRLTDGDLPED